MQDLGRRLPWVIALTLVVVAPLPFGAVTPWARAGLALALAVALVLTLFDRQQSGAPAPAVLASVTLLLALVYIVPLPPAVVGWISPAIRTESRLALATPGAEPSLVAAEEALAKAAGGSRSTPGWRPLAADIDGSIEGTTRVAIAVGAFLLGVITVGTSTGRRRRVMAAVALCAFVQAGYGLAESLSGSHSIFGWHNIYYPGLTSGTFVCPNHFAALVSLGVFCGFGLLATRDSRTEFAPEGSGRSSETMARLAVISTGIGVMVIGLLWSSSRGALVAAACGAAVLIAVLTIYRRMLHRRPVVLLLLCLVVAGLVFGAVAMRPVEPLVTDIEHTGYGYAARVEIWKMSAAIARAFPWMGSGPGTFDAVHSGYRAPDMSARIVHAHSDYLEWWVETGIPGVLLLAAWLGTVAVAAWKAFRRCPDRILTACAGAGMIALAIHEAAEFSLQLPGITVPAGLLMGAIVAPAIWRPELAEQKRQGGVAWPRAVALAATVLVASALVTAWTSRYLAPGSAAQPTWATPEQTRLWAKAEMDTVIAAVRDGAEVTPERRARLGAAYLAAQRAAVREPFRGEGSLTCWETAQAVNATRNPAVPTEGFTKLARYYLERAVALDPANRGRRLLVAKYLSAMGETTLARAELRRLLEIEPGWAQRAYDLLGGADVGLSDLMAVTPNRPASALALAYYLGGQRHDAMGAQVVLERAVSRHPEDSGLRRYYAAVLLMRGNAERALQVVDARPLPANRDDRRAMLQVRAGALAQLQRYDDLESTLRQLGPLGTDPRFAAITRAQARLAAGDNPAAAELLNEVLQRPGPPLPREQQVSLLLMLARAQDRAGQSRDALITYRRVQQVDPDNPEVRTFMTRLDPAQ